MSRQILPLIKITAYGEQEKINDWTKNAEWEVKTFFKRENCTQKVQFNRPTKENAVSFFQNLRDSFGFFRPSSSNSSSRAVGMSENMWGQFITKVLLKLNFSEKTA